MATALFTFNKNILSAAKYSNPPVTNQPTLSAFGVAIISLSTNDVGITFRERTTTPLTSAFTTTSVFGSVFSIDTSFDGSHLAVVTNAGYNVFLHLSSVTSVSVSSITATREVSSPETQRKRLYGFF